MIAAAFGDVLYIYLRRDDTVAQPISIDYDDLAARPQAKVQQICAALGVTIPDFVDLQPNVAKLADAVSLGWIGRFCREAVLDMKTPT